MPDLFDMNARADRRDRAAHAGAPLFMHERAFDDCLERLQLIGRSFERVLLIGCPDPAWTRRLVRAASGVDVRDPGPIFAEKAGGQVIVEDAWEPAPGEYDLVLSIGTLDTVNHLPLAFQLIRHSMREGGLFLGAMAGGDTLPRLRSAMRAADSVTGGAAPHVHPRIEAAALASLLSAAGFDDPVVDVDRVTVSYRSFDALIADLRSLAATNMLSGRPRFIGKRARVAAAIAFADAGDGQRTAETFETLHFAAWNNRQS